MKRFLDFLNGLAIIFTSSPVLSFFLEQKINFELGIIFLLGWLIHILVLLLDSFTDDC